jgi:hypothetical protein
MSGSLLSNLTAATSPEGDELIYVLQDGADRKMTIAQTRIGADAGVGSDDPGTSLTFTAGVGDGDGNSGDFSAEGGLGGSGGTFSYAGGFFGVGGSAATSDYGRGGDAVLASGTGGTSAVYSTAGYVKIFAQNGGLGPETRGGSLELSSGSSVEYKGGNISVNTGASIGAVGDGGDLLVSLGAGGSSGIRGQLKIDGNSSLLPISGSWAPAEVIDGTIIHTSTRGERVTAIMARIKAANGTAATLVLVKCASGVAPGSGVALSTNSVNLAGSVDTNQTLTLHGTAANLLLAAGDSLIMVTTGSLVLAAGAITCWMTPQ